MYLDHKKNVLHFISYGLAIAACSLKRPGLLKDCEITDLIITLNCLYNLQCWENNYNKLFKMKCLSKFFLNFG